MSTRNWWKGDLIASVMLVALFGAAVFVMWAFYHAYAPPEVQVDTYQEALVVCDEWEETPWDVSACQWHAYESFFGTDAAKAAYEAATEAR